MYLAQTNLKVDTTKVYLYGIFKPIEVYLTVPVENASTQIIEKSIYDKIGRDVEIIQLTAERHRRLNLIDNY